MLSLSLSQRTTTTTTTTTTSACLICVEMRLFFSFFVVFLLRCYRRKSVKSYHKYAKQNIVSQTLHEGICPKRKAVVVVVVVLLLLLPPPPPPPPPPSPSPSPLSFSSSSSSSSSCPNQRLDSWSDLEDICSNSCLKVGRSAERNDTHLAVISRYHSETSSSSAGWQEANSRMTIQRID